MKKNNVYLVLLMAFLFCGCEKSDDGSYVAPITIYEKINGTWGLDKLTYVDDQAKANGISPYQEVMTSLFNFQSFVIQLNVDEANRPTTFSVEGEAPVLFLESGYWELDSEYPNTDLTAVKINLYDSASKDKIVDQLRLTSIPSGQGAMEIQLVRVSNGTNYASYVFNLSTITTNL